MRSKEYQKVEVMTLLRGGDSMEIDCRQQDNPLPVAQIFFDGKGLNRDQDKDAQPGSQITIIDLRSAPQYNGYYEYDGQQLGSPFIALDQANLDWEKGRGFKGIWPNEPVVFGRGQYEDRFSVTRGDISRTQVSVLFDPAKNCLRFTDGLGATRPSANGTSVLTGGISSSHNQPSVKNIVEVGPYGKETLSRTLGDGVVMIDHHQVIEKSRELYASRNILAITHSVLSIGNVSGGGYDKSGNAGSFAPYIGLSINEREFLFSKITQPKGETRKYSVCYSVGEGGVTIPYMFYKSNSDGGWRMSPYIYGNNDLNKGDIAVAPIGGKPVVEYGQYVQATKPDESIVALLEEMELHPSEAVQDVEYQTIRKLYESLHFYNYHNSGVLHSFNDAVNAHIVRGVGLMSYRSGYGFGDNHPDTARCQLESMTLPDGLEPDFRGGFMTRKYSTQHTLLGLTKVEVYEGMYEGRVVEWHVASDDKTDTVWLDRIVFKDGDINQYGVSAEIILAGALNAKPVDYRDQTHGMVRDIDYVNIQNSDYASIKPTLDRYPYVKRFRQARQQRG